MPKIVLVDCDFEDTDYERARAEEAGVDIACFQSRAADDIIANAHDADGIITSYGNFPRRVFESLSRLRVVSRTGVGIDLIDLQAATEHGVAICTAPGYGTEVVSDHAISLALCVLRRINELDADMRKGIWDYTRWRPLGQVSGRCFGVVGMGNIGRATARKAYGLGFQVVCCSRSLQPGRKTPEGFEILDFEELLQKADVVSFHTALTPQTYHLLNEDTLSLLKTQAVVVNTARGGIIDTVALAKRLCDGKLWGAGLDVFEEEPIDFNHPICHAPHTVLSAHAAYWSEESGSELRQRTMQSALDVVFGRRPADCLNPEVFGDPAFSGGSIS